MTPAGFDNQLVDARTGRTTTWGDLRAVEIPAPAAVVVGSSFEAFPWVAEHARTGAELLVVAASRMEAVLEEELRHGGFHVVEDHAEDGYAVLDPTVEREPEQDRLWLLTSGSTGRPKQIGHTLQSLTTVKGNLPARRWLCPYSPGTYAWWQVVTLGLAHPGQDLVVVDPSALDGWVGAAIEHGVTAASGTPTFWRQTLMSQPSLEDVPLEQISLGGEPVDQAVLDQLRELFPEARISWIYASSELGASIVVHDGRAGFPVEWLGRSEEGRPIITVSEGELVITSPHHGQGLEGAIRTGDAVVEQDGRILITGRVDSDEINVGGQKVSAGVVRSVVQSHPDVAWAHVRGRKSPLVGSMVVAEVVLADGATATTDDLTTWCRERLPEYGVPRRIKLLDAIPAKETLKSDV